MTAHGTGLIRDFWQALPEELKRKLRLGFTGKRHLLDIAGWCLRSGAKALQPVAVDAVLAAFGENPLDGEMASELVSNKAIRDLLPATSLRAMHALVERWHRPEHLGYFERLLKLRDFPKLKKFIGQSVEREPDNLFWREQAVTFGLIDNDVDWVRSMIDMPLPTGMPPGLDAIGVRLNCLDKAYNEAASLAEKAGDVFGRSYKGRISGLFPLRDDGAAKADLMESVEHSPWDVGLILRAHDILTGRDKETKRLDGSVAILLYSWNKAEELDSTLHSLFHSHLTDASIVVLDNGSTDTTHNVLAAWQGRFTDLLGENRFELISLPVNIGAPPARNWLMHHPLVSDYDYMCYIDDDVELPPDWLEKLAVAVDHYPDAGVWGCKVVDHANPALIQSADSHLLVESEVPPLNLSSPTPNPFRLSNLPIQSMDTGYFNFLRPCASVTGCCHLFRTQRLKESGDFAIQLSPTQYDDMEHDLRLCISGHFAVYQGHLSVRHKKNTGSASHTSAQEEGNALGNKYKMQTMHTHEALMTAMQTEQTLLDNDILKKIKRVENVLLSSKKNRKIRTTDWAT